MDTAMWKRVYDAWYNVLRIAIENLYKYVPRPIAIVIEATIGLSDISSDAYKHVNRQCVLMIQLLYQ